MSIASNSAVIASSASASPVITVLAGPLIAAMPARSRYGAITGPSWVASAKTAAIVPFNVAMSRVRSATRRAPSSSVITPATTAAAYSPRLCPTSAVGCTPQLCHKRDNPTCNANVLDWAIFQSDVSRFAMRKSISSAHVWTVSRTIGSDSSNCCPRCSYSAPVPVNRNATFGRFAAVGVAVVSASISSLGVWPTAPIRNLCCDRPRLAVAQYRATSSV